VLVLRYGYHRTITPGDPRYGIGTTGATSPGDLRVLSRGNRAGSLASVWLNGRELAGNGRGYNLVAIDAHGGVVKSAVFDTFLAEDESEALAEWVARLPAGTIVAGAVRDEGSLHLTVAAVEALRSLGVSGDLRGRNREAHAFVGRKGSAAGSAVEALGGDARDLRVGQPDPADRVALELTEFRLSGVR
jgi:hypothetical protein